MDRQECFFAWGGQTRLSGEIPEQSPGGGESLWEEGAREKCGRCKDPAPGPLHVLWGQQGAWLTERSAGSEVREAGRPR